MQRANPDQAAAKDLASVITLAQVRDRKDTLSAWQIFFRKHFEAIWSFLVARPAHTLAATSIRNPGLLCLRRFEDRWAGFLDLDFSIDQEHTELTEAEVLLDCSDLA